MFGDYARAKAPKRAPVVEHRRAPRSSECWRVIARRADALDFVSWEATTSTRDGAYRLLLSCEGDASIGRIEIRGARWHRAWGRDASGRWQALD